MAVTLLGLAIAVGVGAVSGAVVEVASAPPAAQASSVGGTITRSEVLARAQYWVDRKVTYGTVFDDNGNVVSTQSAPDPDGKNYRTDCSGLVSMAWHLTNSPTTTQFLASGGSNPWNALGSVHDLKPGDAMVHSGHIELFAYWKNNGDHSKGAFVYSFNSFGETVRNPYAYTNQNHFGFNSWSELTSYTPIRYANIQDDAPPPAPPAIARQSGWMTFNGVDGSVSAYGNSAGQLVQKYYTVAGGWSSWINLGGTITGTPEVTFNPANGAVSVYANSGGQLVQKYYTVAGGWSSWINLGGTISGAPDLTFDPATGSVNVFANSGGQLVQKYYTVAGGWSSWINLGGTITGAPEVTFNPGNGAVSVYANSGGQLVQKYYTVAGGWSSWIGLGGSIADTPTVLFNTADDSVNVFAISGTGELMQKYYTVAGNWSSWINLGGSLS